MLEYEEHSIGGLRLQSMRELLTAWRVRAKVIALSAGRHPLVRHPSEQLDWHTGSVKTMRHHLNTLFVTLEAAFLSKDGTAVDVRLDGASRMRIPLHNLEGIVCFGWNITCSTALMAACADANVSLSFHSPHGRFLACSNGFVSGNILLRREQYRRADHEAYSAGIAANMIRAKLANARIVLLRSARDHGKQNQVRADRLLQATDLIANRVKGVQSARSLDLIRGIEGEAASVYFEVFPLMIQGAPPGLEMRGRTRRPPLDPVNALLSFLYSLLMHDCRSALESCGLDSQCGFLHRDRPGRPSLALDLMEEFRPVLADRAALTLINRKQICAKDFNLTESGGVHLNEDGRRTVLTHWQERKAEEVLHPFLDERVTIGLLPHLQARLLARHLRGDLDSYPAFLAK